MLFRRLLTYAKFQAEQVKAMAKPKVVFVLGGPGAGKGTQCEKIVKEFGYVHLSAGELLRVQRRTEGSQFGSLIEGHMRDGTIVPVAITCSLLEKAMMETMKQDNSKDRFLIDGFPRNRDNLDGWNKQMGEKASVQFVLFFDCDEQTCIDRCLSRGESGSGRSDDNLESTKKRIVTYNESTRPIIEHYDSMGLVRKVKSTNTVDEVFADVKKVFEAVKTD